MFHDVRMRGFKRRADVEEVIAWLDDLPLVLHGVEVPLELADGEVLVEPLVSEVDVPAFPRSAMDGWAVRAADTFGASETDPIPLAVTGLSLPGKPHGGSVGRGQAVRIMTGAAVPEGADSVLRAEDGEERDGTLQARAGVPQGKNVGAIGEDIVHGTELLQAGRVLRPQDVGVAASIGRASLPVALGPEVAILVTGDELLAAGSAPDGVHIVDSNGPMLRALSRRDGCRGDPQVVMVPDEEPVLRETLEGLEADVVIVTGGSSVGEEDHAPRLLDDLGVLQFHGVALRPAAPTGMGLLGEKPVFLLPGNPVSCLCGYDFFASRVVRRMAGRHPEWPYIGAQGFLTRKISSVLGRVDYVRVKLVDDGIEPVMSRGASILSSTTEADGFVIVERDSEGHPEGTEVEVFLYDVLRT